MAADLLQELNNFGVGQQVSDKHVDDISLSSCQKWRFLPSHLDLPSILVEDIERNPRAVTESDKRHEFFQAWKAAKGSEATYRELIRALLAIGCRQDAEYVCDLLMSSSSGGGGGGGGGRDGQASGAGRSQGTVPSSDTSHLRSRPSGRAG